MNITSFSEKKRTRDVKYLAVAQWLRSMPEEGETDPVSDRRNQAAGADKDSESFTNITINVEQASDIDKTHSDENLCNESSVNACSTKPLRLHGSKCRINDPDEKSKILDIAKGPRRVKFDIKANNDNADYKEGDDGKRVKYDVIIRTAEEDNAELKRSLTKFLAESAARKDLKNQHLYKKYSKSSKYIANTEDVECHMVTGLYKQATSTEDSRSTGRSRKSSYSTVKEFDDVIFDKHILHTGTPGYPPQRTLCHQSTMSAWSPGAKRVNRQKPKIVYLKYSSGTQKIQTPVIKGLVVDVVENQKPSVIRASKNANIREEFALKQKVEGYRAFYSQSVNRINFAQRKLSANLITLRNRMAARAQADDKCVDGHYNVKTVSEELFMQSKGYFPETRPGSRAYNFPPLKYPKRRVLTIS